MASRGPGPAEASVSSLSGDGGSWQCFDCFHVPGSDDGIRSKEIWGWGPQDGASKVPKDPFEHFSSFSAPQHVETTILLSVSMSSVF